MRRHKRTPIVASATISFEAGSDRVIIEAFVSNVSFSGIGLYTNAPLEMERGVSVQLKFIAADHGVHKVDLEGSVVYCKQIEPLYFTGIELNEEITGKTQPVLHAHLSRVIGWDEEHE